MSSTELDPRDRRLAASATGLLRIFNEADVLEAADCHVASRFGAILGESRESVLLAAGLAVRAVRHGSICVDLSEVADLALDLDDDAPDLDALPWPETGAWLADLAASPLVTEQVLRVEGSTVYLDRYWREEQQVCHDLVARIDRPAPEIREDLLEAGLARVFPADAGYDEQRAAVRAGARRWTMILTGGPGTGKTTTVAGLLALLSEQHESELGRRPRIALCAPTGKAAARLHEAVAEAGARFPDQADRDRVRGLESRTLHRLLGWRPDSSVRFKHHRGHRLPYDVVVVDETSMVSLSHMARLLEALRPSTRLVLVGDPDQLASVEAGAVLADLVKGLRDLPDSPVVSLERTHRFGEEIRRLARALRDDDAEEAMAALRAGGDSVEWIDPEDPDALVAFRDSVVDVAARMRVAADQGDVKQALDSLDAHRLLCAHREGRYGVAGWNRLVEQLVGERLGVSTWDEWYSGRPVLVTANQGQRLNNGDIGVTLRRSDGRLRVVMADGRELAPTRLPDVQTMFAMTVHKSQGSQARVVSVVMPPEDSPLLTRELFYTAVTRAEEKVRVVGTEAAVRAAIGRNVQRASGLERRLSDAVSGRSEPVQRRAAPGTAPGSGPARE